MPFTKTLEPKISRLRHKAKASNQRRNKTGKVRTYNVILRRVSVSIFAVEKQCVTYSQCVFVLFPLLTSLQSACAVLYCYLWPVWLCHFFSPTLSHIGHDFRKKKNTEHTVCVLTFSTICGNKMPTKCNRGFYCRSDCLLNMFRASLCPSVEGYVSDLQDAAASCKPDT